jgi:hypothetical protein
MAPLARSSIVLDSAHTTGSIKLFAAVPGDTWGGSREWRDFRRLKGLRCSGDQWRMGLSKVSSLCCDTAGIFVTPRIHFADRASARDNCDQEQNAADCRQSIELAVLARNPTIEQLAGAQSS